MRHTFAVRNKSVALKGFLQLRRLLPEMIGGQFLRSSGTVIGEPITVKWNICKSPSECFKELGSEIFPEMDGSFTSASLEPLWRKPIAVHFYWRVISKRQLPAHKTSWWIRFIGPRHPEQLTPVLHLGVIFLWNGEADSCTLQPIGPRLSTVNERANHNFSDAALLFLNGHEAAKKLEELKVQRAIANSCPLVNLSKVVIQ